MRILVLLAAAATRVRSHSHENEYVKYPLYDGYVRSCSQKEENFGFEETLEVRRYMPNIRSRDWAASDTSYDVADDHEARTTRVETRFYHTTDAESMRQTLDGQAQHDAGDPDGAATGKRPNVADAYTATRGTTTAAYDYPHTTGPYHTNLDEGTLDPFDQSALGGWCGEDPAGDRVTFLLFDLHDFDADGLGNVTLRLTPRHFPWKATVEVRGACSAAAAGSTRQLRSAMGPLAGMAPVQAEAWYDPSGGAPGGPWGLAGGGGGEAYGGAAAEAAEGIWHEGSLTWETAPFIHDDDRDRVLCAWAGDRSGEELYPDARAPLECDVTAVAKAHGERYLCLTVDMVHAPGNSREPVSFWSRDYRGEGSAGWEGGGPFGSERIGAEMTSSGTGGAGGGGGVAVAFGEAGVGGGVRDVRQSAEGGDWRRPNAQTVSGRGTRDGAMGDRTASAAGAGGGGGAQRAGQPGLEFGTVRRARGGASSGDGRAGPAFGGETWGGAYSAGRPGGAKYDGGRLDLGGGGRHGPWGAAEDAAATRRPHLIIEGSENGRFADHSALH